VSGLPGYDAWKTTDADSLADEIMWEAACRQLNTAELQATAEVLAECLDDLNRPFEDRGFAPPLSLESGVDSYELRSTTRSRKDETEKEAPDSDPD